MGILLAIPLLIVALDDSRSGFFATKKPAAATRNPKGNSNIENYDDLDEADIAEVYDAPPSPDDSQGAMPVQPDYGQTIVRVTAGSHEKLDRAGSWPHVAIFSEWGERIGQTYSSSASIAASFKDIVIHHTEEHANVRASYLSIHGSNTTICMTSVGIQFPDGVKQFLTGSDLDFCAPHYPELNLTHASRTFFGPNSAQPKCFFVSGDAQGLPQRLTLHLPDFSWTRARRNAYVNDTTLACRKTPRFWPEGQFAHGGWKIDDPIPIFNPPIDYDPNTGFDEYPERILSWAENRTHTLSVDWSDRKFILQPKWTPPKNGTNSTQILKRNTNAVHSVNFKKVRANTVPFKHARVEVENIRTGPPKLVISAGALKVQEQCLRAEFNNTDYVSLSERIYCDMQSRSMLRFCEQGKIIENCWNHTTQKLQGAAHLRDNVDALGKRFVNVGGNDTLPLWMPTGPLYGYAYHHVTLMA